MHFERRDNRVLAARHLERDHGERHDVAGRRRGRGVERPSDPRDLQRRGLRPDSAAVIDVSRLFTQPPQELSPAAAHWRGLHDRRDALVDRARRVVPRQRERLVDADVAARRRRWSRCGGCRRRGGWSGAAPDSRAPSATIVASYSFHKLPETPMEPRLCDNRVGYFSLTVTDYSQPTTAHGEQQRCFITRYRLEKKDPNAAISEPVKPIVYYLDANTPMKWRP